jgi:hypothetical protein
VIFISPIKPFLPLSNREIFHEKPIYNLQAMRAVKDKLYALIWANEWQVVRFDPANGQRFVVMTTNKEILLSHPSKFLNFLLQLLLKITTKVFMRLMKALELGFTMAMIMKI